MRSSMSIVHFHHVRVDSKVRGKFVIQLSSSQSEIHEDPIT